MKNEIDTNMTLYDVNKQLMEKEPPLDPLVLNSKLMDLMQAMLSQLDTKRHETAWMLLCHERRDYTIFYIKNYDAAECNFITDMSECLSNRGIVTGIDKQKDGTYEIWIRDIGTNENFVYYFFDYNEGMLIYD